MKKKKKIVQIYEAVADIALAAVKSVDGNHSVLSQEDIELIRITQSLYECINANPPKIQTASALDMPAE